MADWGTVLTPAGDCGSCASVSEVNSWCCHRLEAARRLGLPRTGIERSVGTAYLPSSSGASHQFCSVQGNAGVSFIDAAFRHLTAGRTFRAFVLFHDRFYSPQQSALASISQPASAGAKSQRHEPSVTIQMCRVGVLSCPLQHQIHAVGGSTYEPILLETWSRGSTFHVVLESSQVSSQLHLVLVATPSL